MTVEGSNAASHRRCFIAVLAERRNPPRPSIYLGLRNPKHFPSYCFVQPLVMAFVRNCRGTHFHAFEDVKISWEAGNTVLAQYQAGGSCLKCALTRKCLNGKR